MGKAKTAILVTFFTVLIWVLAEGESLQTQRTVADVSFPTTASEAYSVRLADGEALRGGIDLLVEGPTASLDGLETALRRPILLSPGDGLPRESGEHTINLREALREHEEFRSRGVTVLSAEPSTVRVVIEELATRSFPIRVEAPLEELDGAAQLAGVAQAEVRLPARASGALPEGAGIVVARVRSEDLASLQEGVRSTVQVRLEPGPQLASAGVLAIQPAQVSVQLTVRSKTESTVISTLNVDVRGQLDELSKWEITLDPPVLRDVTVTGPSELVRKIEEGTLVLRPFVWLAFDELREGTMTKRVEFSDFSSEPQALNLRFEVEDQEVEVTVRPREAGGGGAPAGQPPPG